MKEGMPKNNNENSQKHINPKDKSFIDYLIKDREPIGDYRKSKSDKDKKNKDDKDQLSIDKKAEPEDPT